MAAFFLVLIVVSYTPRHTTTPIPMATLEACREAGRAVARDHTGGGARVYWTCVSTGATHDRP